MTKEDLKDCLESEEVELKKQVDLLKYETALAERAVKTAWNRMMFSYQFFAEDRELFTAVKKRHMELDRSLAELDGRLKKIKAKEPRQQRVVRQKTGPKMTQKQLVDYLSGLPQEEKEAFVEKMMRELKL